VGLQQVREENKKIGGDSIEESFCSKRIAENREKKGKRETRNIQGDYVR
jgi:hypothetical protein